MLANQISQHYMTEGKAPGSSDFNRHFIRLLMEWTVSWKALIISRISSKTGVFMAIVG